MNASLSYLLKHIKILHDASDSRDAEFVCYKIGDNDIETKLYAVNQLAKEKAILISHRIEIYEIGFGIAYVRNNEPRLLHNVAFDDFIDNLGNANISDKQLSLMIKNCNREHQEKIIGYLENKKLDSLIKTQNKGNQLLF